MIIEQTSELPVGIERLWAFLVDAPAVARCLPGVERFEELDGDRYQGTVKIKLGPIALRLAGGVRVLRRDRETWTAEMLAEGRDGRVSGQISARMTMRLAVLAPDATELRVVTDAAILGKLGEFGQPMIRKTADRIMGQFMRNAAEAMAALSAA